MTPLDLKPILPRKRPWWLLVLAAMLVFGFYQERAKIRLNHYLSVMEAHPELASMSEELRSQWWQEHPQPLRIHYYIMEGTWEEFHGWSMRDLARFKWALSIGILLVFFGLDALFLRSTDHLERWPWLVVMYGISGCIMVLSILLLPGKSGYSVAHEFLVFLQSPLPSLLIVLVPSLFERMNAQNESIRD